MTQEWGRARCPGRELHLDGLHKLNKQTQNCHPQFSAAAAEAWTAQVPSGYAGSAVTITHALLPLLYVGTDSSSAPLVSQKEDCKEDSQMGSQAEAQIRCHLGVSWGKEMADDLRGFVF